MRPTVVILAAGLGTRMKSALPKALHRLGGKPLILHVLEAVTGLEPERTVLVLGHHAAQVRQAVEGFAVETVMQERQLGTGHAVRQASEAIATATGPVSSVSPSSASVIQTLFISTSVCRSGSPSAPLTPCAGNIPASRCCRIDTLVLEGGVVLE